MEIEVKFSSKFRKSSTKIIIFFFIIYYLFSLTAQELKKRKLLKILKFAKKKVSRFFFGIPINKLRRLKKYFKEFVKKAV